MIQTQRCIQMMRRGLPMPTNPHLVHGPKLKLLGCQFINALASWAKCCQNLAAIAQVTGYCILKLVAPLRLFVRLMPGGSLVTQNFLSPSIHPDGGGGQRPNGGKMSCCRTGNNVRMDGWVENRLELAPLYSLTPPSFHPLTDRPTDPFLAGLLQFI